MSISTAVGSGKSESWIKGIIYQCAERNHAGFVYDWEVIPPRTSHPSSRIAYGSIEHFRNKGMETPRFAYINFVDMSRTVRVNVLSPQYMSKGNESLFIRNIIMTLMKNLETSWKERPTFGPTMPSTTSIQSPINVSRKGSLVSVRCPM